MKKLMIAAAIVCAAAFAQAATISWGSGTIYTAKDAAGTTGTSLAGMNAVTMYVYALTSDPVGQEGGMTAAEKYAAAQKMDAAGLYDAFYKAGVTPAGSKKTVPTGQTQAVSQPVGDASGLNYAVILFVDDTNANLGDKEAFVKSVVTSTNIEGSGMTTRGNMIGSAQSDWTAVPVPEPTSGLLLLLGVAGMALRRRRA